MTSLTEISIATRKLFVWLIIAFIAYLFLRFLVGIIISNLPRPAPVIEPPNALFNKIPNPAFPNIASSSSGMIFVLENIEGKPPETTSSARVYSMPKKMPSFLTNERATDFATKLGFTADPEIVSSFFFRFIDPKNNLRTIELDGVNLNFILKYDYLQNIELFNHQQVIKVDNSISEVKNYLQSNSLFDASVLQGKVTTQLLYFDTASKKFSPVNNLSSANALRINFFRQDLDGWKIIPPGFNESFNYVIYVPSLDTTNNILEIQYTFWPIDINNFGTYPLRNAVSAWQDLIDGYAYVVNMGRNTPDKIVIRNIYLAYYDSEKPQSFLQPIYVFEGDNDFVAYLPAVASEWLE